MTKAAVERVLQQIENDRQRIIEFEQDLIRIPSEVGNEKACQEFLAKWLTKAGYQIDIFTPNEMPGIFGLPGRPPIEEYINRPNVVAVYPGTGGGKSLLLMSHVDTVPLGPLDKWTYGPYDATIADGKIYGRGAGDDKEGITAQTMALECIRRANLRLKGNVILCSVVDEESSIGMGSQACMARGYRADAGIYCDGVNLALHPANLGGVRGYIRFRTGITEFGLDTAKRCADTLYNTLVAFREERVPTFKSHHLYGNTMWPASNLHIPYMSIGYDDGFAFSDGVIKFYAYILPGTEPQLVKETIEKRILQAWGGLSLPSAAPTIQWFGRDMEPYEIPLSESIIKVLQQAYEGVTGQIMPIEGQPGSDLYILGNYSDGMPAVATGPSSFGVAEGAHEPNESISIDGQLMPFVKTIALTMLEWCGWEREDIPH